MSEPTTELDTRFSDPGAVPTTWQQTLRAIQTADIFWISTVRADGRPHVTPLVAVWLDDALHFCTGPAEQKALDLRGNAHVVLTTGCNQWDAGVDVVVAGEARQVTDEAVLARLAEAWAGKWDGRWRFQARGGAFHHQDSEGVALVFSVQPTKILAFAKGSFGHTRHRFRFTGTALMITSVVTLRPETGHPRRRWCQGRVPCAVRTASAIAATPCSASRME